MMEQKWSEGSICNLAREKKKTEKKERERLNSISIGRKTFTLHPPILV